MSWPSDQQARSGVRAGDLLAEAAVGITIKPTRSILTLVGIAVGVAALTTTVGLAATSTRAVSERFDDLRAQEVTLVTSSFENVPSDIERLLAALPGVRVGGVLGPATGQLRPVNAFPSGPSVEVPILVATWGGLAAVRPTVVGRTLNQILPDQRVALLGGDLASALGVRIRSSPTTVFIDRIPFTVIGIIEQSERETDLVGSVVMPVSVAATIWPDPVPTVLVDVEAGAARQVAAAAPLALRPEDPGAFEAILMPEARRLRTAVSDELSALGLAVAATVFIIAGLAVAATMMLSILERRQEIGLHRALGARPIHVGIRFLAEAALIGALGGIVGASSGVIIVSIIGTTRDTSPTMPLWVLATSAVLGLVISLIAGAYPAYRAGRLDPIDALRG